MKPPNGPPILGGGQLLIYLFILMAVTIAMATIQWK
jgi:hypothetical protein